MRDFDHSLPMALLRARESVMRRFRPILSEHGLSEQQWRVLRALADRGVPSSVRQLADSTFLLGPSLSRMLVPLEERRLIRRSSDPDDRRRAVISITDTGRALVASIAPDSEREYDRISALLGDDELTDLYRLLARIASIV